jgi:hypothetical protein
MVAPGRACGLLVAAAQRCGTSEGLAIGQARAITVFATRRPQIVEERARWGTVSRYG